ncbi:GspE/PulE family protein [Candidatus Omnitrophota bacterium]
MSRSVSNRLLRDKLLTDEQLAAAVKRCRATGRSLYEVVVEMELLKEPQMLEVLSEIFNIPVITLDKKNIDVKACAYFSYATVKRYGVFPACRDVDFLIVAMSGPDIVVLDDLQRISGMPVKAALCTKKEIAECIDEVYQPLDKEVAGIFKGEGEEVTVERVADTEGDLLSGRRDTLDVQQWDMRSAPVVKLANHILYRAVAKRASDIHIEPTEHYVDIRYRVDGVMIAMMKVQPHLQAALVARVKILANLNIAETKKPQDGRVRIQVNQRKIDLRIATLPTFYGEKVALRVLDKQVAKTQLSQIGLGPRELKLLTKAVSGSQGMVLVTGPTGSGKTSTLYAALSFIHKIGGKNIVTIEDPIEYLLAGINQTQVNPAKNYDFATGLRSIVRQDPNVILVGEIRDSETAKIAFRSSLTGHLVLSTLHTNCTISTVTRLLDIGIEPYLIASSLILIAAQRLVRVICPHCRTPYRPDERIVAHFVEEGYMDRFNFKEFYAGKGCSACDFTGFLGRAAIFEIMKVNKRLRYLIARNAPEDEIFREARKDGLKLLIESGIDKVNEGITTLEEVARVVNASNLDESLDISAEAPAYKEIVSEQEIFRLPDVV